MLTLPPSARARRLETGRGSFAVLDAGEPRRGTVLLVPGFTGSKEDFIALLQPLAEAGLRAVAVDGRGQYETGGPRVRGAYAQDELAADLLAQGEALGGPVHLVGHSMGGQLARAAVLRGGGPWASLTLMSSGPAAIDEGQRVRTRLLVEALAATDLESIWRTMRAMDAEQAAARRAAGGPGGGGEPPLPSGIEEFLHQRWLANVPEQLAVTGEQLTTEPDRVAELAAVPLPKLVISGEVDYAWPVPWLDEMARRLAARRVVIPGAEHSPNAERPGGTARALLDFWFSGSVAQGGN
ncbi:hydrolase [Streptantibioticus cattleyicolor NRRL 8057 = DSM 46488]|uniref:Hydrolase n=2 Tax=Kitasatosporales TaxID=85011 RepID=F8K4M2_STREN|nr:hydrolase [Streptantibioticus cattleyicolor NRRL 8057 = DSM 46488]MYS60890.1 alpha/beta fold hydrolase [Streptomyces sp. SID5468]CCB76717.1 Hydrolase [Streptantibioticus cattleyicolor NRRL 8057 = DSM 46488]